MVNVWAVLGGAQRLGGIIHMQLAKLWSVQFSKDFKMEKVLSVNVYVFEP